MTDGRHEDDVAHGTPFLSFVEPSGRMNVQEFAAAYGPAFLVLVTSRPAGPRVRGATAPRTTRDEPTGEAGVYVSPLVRKPGSQSPLVRVGRGEACDVVLADVSVSKLHAFVQIDAGEFSLLDAGSRNGTFVGEERVNARGVGPPTALPLGARVRFGSVTMTFVDAGQLYTAARQRLK